MSQNFDTLRAMFEAFNRRDFDDALQHAHREVELRPGLTELDVDTRYRGRDEVKRFMGTITGPWEAYVIEPKETIEAPGERVVVVESWHARGRDGIEFDFELTDVYTFRDGLVVRIEGFGEREDALEAAGLAQHDAPAE